MHHCLYRALVEAEFRKRMVTGQQRMGGVSLERNPAGADPHAILLLNNERTLGIDGSAGQRQVDV